MKFLITCEYQVTASGYTTKHRAVTTINATSAARAVTQFLDDLGGAFDATITNIVLTCSILH